MLELLAVATEHAVEAEHHVEPTAFGLTPGAYVALAMIVVFLLMWRAGVPRIVVGILDSRIADIKKQLDEAAKLRDEAAALKASYEKKAAEADEEIAALRANAEKQAADIVAKAQTDAEMLVARRKAMAEDKIAAAERAAVEELRAIAADASTVAAAKLIAEHHDASADKALADEVIANL